MLIDIILMADYILEIPRVTNFLRSTKFISDPALKMNERMNKWMKENISWTHPLEFLGEEEVKP